MIKVYKVTPLGKRFLKEEVTGVLRKEMQGSLRTLLEDSVDGKFPFDPTEDHLFRHHILLLEHYKLVERDKILEQQIKDSISSKSSLP